MKVDPNNLMRLYLNKLYACSSILLTTVACLTRVKNHIVFEGRIWDHGDLVWSSGI
jgi:hypothetical protein